MARERNNSIAQYQYKRIYKDCALPCTSHTEITITVMASTQQTASYPQHWFTPYNQLCCLHVRIIYGISPVIYRKTLAGEMFYE